MKARSTRRFTSLSVALFYLAVFCVSPALAQNPPQPTGLILIGSISMLEGQVTVIHRGEEKPGEVGTPIYQHDIIKTGAEGKLRIEFNDESIVSIGPESLLSISQYVYDPVEKKRSSRLKLAFGKLKAMVNDLVGYRDKKFEVATQTAVIGVRGTDLVVVSAEKVTQVASIDKPLNVGSLSGQDYVVMTELEYTRVLSGEAPMATQPLTAEIYKAMVTGLLAVDAILPAGLAAAASTGGSASAGATGSVAASTGLSTGATVGITAGALAVIGAGIAIAAGSDDGADTTTVHTTPSHSYHPHPE